MPFTVATMVSERPQCWRRRRHHRRPPAARQRCPRPGPAVAYRRRRLAMGLDRAKQI